MEYYGFRFECMQADPEVPDGTLRTLFIAVAVHEQEAWEVVGPLLPDPEATTIIGRGLGMRTWARKLGVANSTAIREPGPVQKIGPSWLPKRGKRAEPAKAARVHSLPV